MADVTDEGRAARAIALLEKAARVVERFVTRGAEELDDVKENLEEAIARLEELEFDHEGRLLVEDEDSLGEDEAGDDQDLDGEQNDTNCRLQN
jgi:hypothetical protein